MSSEGSQDSEEKRLHDLLWGALETMDEDYEPYGDNNPGLKDCSAGCVFFLELKGKLGDDWGVCGNRESHRFGKLTYEHQGCYEFMGRDELKNVSDLDTGELLDHFDNQ